MLTGSEDKGFAFSFFLRGICSPISAACSQCLCNSLSLNKTVPDMDMFLNLYLNQTLPNKNVSLMTAIQTFTLPACHNVISAR